MDSVKSTISSVHTRYLPIIIAMIWLWGTVGLFALGPFDYPINNKVLLYSYLMAVHLAFLVGYCSCVVSSGLSYKGKWRPIQMFRLSMWISLFTFISGWLEGSGFKMAVGSAIDAPDLAYDAYLQSAGSSKMPYISMFLEPFAAPFIIFVIYYWHSVKPLVRWIAILLFSTTILSSVGAGVRSGIVYLLITVSCAFLAAHYSGQLKLRRFAKTVIAVLVVVGLILIIQYFSIIFSRRSLGTALTFNPMIKEFPDPDHLITQMVPESYQPLVMGSITYITHGYYALSMALEKPFIGITFGVGNSMFLMRNFERLTGLSQLYTYSYANRLILEDDYPVGVFWMTIYPWIASDTTFIGSIIILYFIGRLFAQSWVDAIKGNNPVALITFTLLAGAVFSFPLYNPLQDGIAIAKMLFWLLLWQITRRRYICKL